MTHACTVLRLTGSTSTLRPRLLRVATLLGLAVGILTSIPSPAGAGWSSVGPFVAYWAWDGRVADDGTATLASDRGILQVYRIAADGNSLLTVIDFDRSPWLPDGYLWKVAQLEPGRYGLLFPGIFDGNDLLTAVWVLQEGVSPTAPTLLPFSADWLFADPDGNVLVLGRDPAFLTYTLRSKDDPSIELDAGTIDTPDVEDVAIDGSGHLHIAYSDGGERYRKTTEDGTQLLDLAVPGTGGMKIRTDEAGDVGILSGTSAFYYLPAGESVFQGPTQLRESARPLGSGHVDFGLSQCGDVFACWDYGYYEDPGGDPLTPTCYRGFSVRFAKADGTLGPIINLEHAEWPGCTGNPEVPWSRAIGPNSLGYFLFRDLDGGGQYQNLDVDCAFDTSDLPENAEVFTSRMQVVPNPVPIGSPARLALRWPDAMNDNPDAPVDLRIFDAAGRQVWQGESTRARTSTALAVDLPADLPAGIYRARATSGRTVILGSITLVR